MPFWVCNVIAQLILLVVCLVISIDATQQIPLFIVWVWFSLCVFGLVCCIYQRNPFSIKG